MTTIENEKTVKFVYHLSEAGQKALILAGGDGHAEQTIEAPITEELLSWTRVDADGHIAPILCQKGMPSRVSSYYLSPSAEWHLFDDLQTSDQLIAWMREEMSARKVRQAEADAKAEAEEAARKAYAEKQEKIRRFAVEQEAARLQAAEAQAAAVRQWIAEHGSDYLRRATEMGYDCTDEYVTERAAKELPGYVVDMGDNVGWTDRTSPSPAALDEAERLIKAGYAAQVVWLTHGVEADDDDGWDDDEYEPHEAVVVRKFLGKYDLIRSSDL